MQYSFTKMQSLGNDFVMLNGVAEDIRITPQIARFIADRRFGIGCDQIILAEALAGADGFRMRIFNCDGSEVGQCGNGARCFAGYLTEQGLTGSKRIAVTTETTQMELIVNEDGSVTLGMGRPVVEPRLIPLDVEQAQLVYELSVDKHKVNFAAVSMGNPHAVIEVDDVSSAPVESLGPIMERHTIFPKKANIGFAHYVSRAALNLRVFERGAGETLGCGSGACAAVVAGIRRKMLDRKVVVTLPGGSIAVEWPNDDSQVFLTGSIHRVFESTIEIPEL